MRGLAYKILNKHSAVQEFMGELVTSILVNTLGFEQTAMTWHAISGPDQVAQHSASGVWGIFEAKGGKSKLGTAPTETGGSQMSEKWITWWLNSIVNRNSGMEEAHDLQVALRKRSPMLAAVSSFYIQNGKRGRIPMEYRVGVQKYERGESLKPWTGF